MLNYQDSLERNLLRLEEIANLEFDWNGYGAEPFFTSLVEKTKSIILELEFQPKIFPTAANSIQLEYHSPDGSYFEVEVFEDGVSIMQVLGDDYDNAEFWEFGVDDVDEIRDLVNKFVSSYCGIF